MKVSLNMAHSTWSFSPDAHAQLYEQQNLIQRKVFAPEVSHQVVMLATLWHMACPYLIKPSKMNTLFVKMVRKHSVETLNLSTHS